MKMSFSTRSIFWVIALSAFSMPINAQFLKKLGKKAQKAAERTVERRVEQEASKKTDQTLDSILEPGKKGQQTPPNPNDPAPQNPKNENPTNTQPSDNSNNTATTGPKSIAIYSKFDFVPGDRTLYFDDFSNDFIGDLPAKWNTNGGGEVVTINESDNKWYAITSGSFVVPNATENLPEDYTIELDIQFVGLTGKTTSAGAVQFIVSETDALNDKGSYAMVDINPCQFIAIGPEIRNRFSNDSDPIRNSVKMDLRKVYLEEFHVSIAVNKNRMRFWINENKIFDVPQLIKDPSKINSFKIYMKGLDGQKGEKMLISNIKIAEGGVDLRRKLIAEGKISTNGILFDSGSANIKPESMGIIRQIYQVLQQDSNINLRIVGHTDSDGSDEANMKLSKDRAEAVKNALVSIYGVETTRLTSDGKGELEPVAENSTPEGKAQNRRVEFIKQ